ncbi:MAG: hypothetical protein ACYC0T_00260 [Ramlibacter sp.]
MSGSDSSNDGLGREEQPSCGEEQGGHSGEGADSAMAHMISQGQRQRRHQPEADDHPGSQAS